jgi:hypothetical protein
MAPSRSTIGTSIENAEIIDLMSSEDEKDELSTVAVGKRRRDVHSSGIRATKKSFHPTDSTEHVHHQKSTCMPFITGNVPDSAVCTCELMPLLHKLSSPNILFCSGRQPTTPTTSFLLHIRQMDKWSCGFRSAQVILTAVLPLLPPHHEFYSVSSWQYHPPSGQQHRPVPIPCLHQLQVFLENSWQVGFDPRGAQHYSHYIVGKSAEIGAVEVSTILSYLHLDSCVVQFIKIPKSRNMLGPFVWQYFSQGPCFQCGNDVQTSCTEWALALLNAVSSQHASQDNDRDDDTCSCPLIPLYLQWQGHSVCIVGIENNLDEFDFLLFDPIKPGDVLRRSLESTKATDVLKPMRMSAKSLAKRDVQILICSPRELSLEERNVICNQGGGNVVTAAATAVIQYRQEQQR